MQLKVPPERLEQRRERALVASLGPLEIDGHRINDTRSVGNGPAGPFSGLRGVFHARTPAKEMWWWREKDLCPLTSQNARTCARRLAYGPTAARPRPSGRGRAQLLRHRTAPSLRDHLPPRGPRLLDRDRRAGAGDGHGDGRSGDAPFGCAPRSFQSETD